MNEIVPGFLLGGRVRHDQFRHGHRTGLEPVLLAASIPALPGARVLEGGTGSGAALLCLAARVAVVGVGCERDPDLADLARRNLAANGCRDIAIVTTDLTGGVAGAFDHAFANPPWHAPAGTASPDPGKEAAKRADDGLLADWAKSLAAPLRPRGTLTFVIAAGSLPEALSGWPPAGLGSPTVLPLWPGGTKPAKLMLVRGIKSGRAPFRLLAGLTLHRDDGSFTEAADAILRGGAPLPME